MFIISTDSVNEGYRNYTDEEIAHEFLKIDADQSYFITKNEWMMYFLKMYEDELEVLDQEAPDAIMSRIQQLSDEFDRIDTDHSGQIDFYEFKEFLTKNVYISE